MNVPLYMRVCDRESNKQIHIANGGRRHTTQHSVISMETISLRRWKLKSKRIEFSTVTYAERRTNKSDIVSTDSWTGTSTKYVCRRIEATCDKHTRRRTTRKPWRDKDVELIYLIKKANNNGVLNSDLERPIADCHSAATCIQSNASSTFCFCRKWDFNQVIYTAPLSFWLCPEYNQFGFKQTAAHYVKIL